MKTLISITAVVFLAMFLASCAKYPKFRYYKIKVAPDKFATIKEVVTSTEEIARYWYRETGKIYIRYNGVVFPPIDVKAVTSGLNAIGDDAPITLMEYNNKLYLVIREVTKQAPNNLFEFYEQDGDKFRKITYKEFPKSVALKNFFKPGRGQIVDEFTGHKGTHFLNWENSWMRTDESEEFVDGKCVGIIDRFDGSETGELWYYLETGEYFRHLTNDGYKKITVEFFKSYIEKYNPVRMKVEEMQEITASEAGFDKSK